MQLLGRYAFNALPATAMGNAFSNLVASYRLAGTFSRVEYDAAAARGADSSAPVDGADDPPSQPEDEFLVTRKCFCEAHQAL